MKLYEVTAERGGRVWDSAFQSDPPRYGTDADSLGVRHPSLLTTLSLWQKLRGDRPAPRRADFDPLDLGRYLRNVFLIEVLPDGDYLYRVTGTLIVEHVGFESSRRRLSSLGEYVDIDRIKSDFDDFTGRMTGRYDKAMGPWRGLEWRAYHRLMLPFSQHGETVSHILGCIELEEGMEHGG